MAARGGGARHTSAAVTATSCTGHIVGVLKGTGSNRSRSFSRSTPFRCSCWVQGESRRSITLADRPCIDTWYHPPSSAFSAYRQTSRAVSHRPRHRADRVGLVPSMTPHFVRSKTSKALEHSASGRALGRLADRPRPSTSLRCCSCDGGRKLLKCCPQRARRRLPLGGRLACIRIRRRPADEHACRPNSCRLMLGEHTSIAARQPSQQEQRVAHERGTSASSFAIVHLRM